MLGFYPVSDRPVSDAGGPLRITTSLVWAEIAIRANMLGGYQHGMTPAGPGRRLIQLAERRTMIVTDHRADNRSMREEGPPNV